MGATPTENSFANASRYARFFSVSGSFSGVLNWSSRNSEQPKPNSCDIWRTLTVSGVTAFPSRSVKLREKTPLRCSAMPLFIAGVIY